MDVVARVINKALRDEKGVSRAYCNDVIEVEPRQKIKVSFISSSSAYRQGICILFKGEGTIVIDGKEYGNEAILWENSTYNSVLIEFQSENKGLIVVNNVCRDERVNVRGRRYWSYADWMGMMIEISNSKHTYRCSDCEYNEYFDSLIFSIELLDS